MSATAWLTTNNNLIQYFDNAGQIGIGCSNPNYRLDVGVIANFRSNVTLQSDAYIGNTLTFTKGVSQNKLLALYDGVPNDSSASASNFLGFGINTNTLRYQVPDTQNHKWYVGNTNVFSMFPTGASNYGDLAVNEDINVGGEIVNTGYTRLSNLSMWSSNTSTFASNALVVTSNAAFFASNTSLWSSNTSYWSSNNLVSTSNAAFFSSNTSVWSSNIARYASNTVVPTSNAAFFASNSCIWSSNTSFWSSNIIDPTSNAAFFASNVAVSVSNKAFNSSWSNNTNKIMKSLDTSNPLNIVCSWQNPMLTNNAYHIVLETTQYIANQSMFGCKKKRVTIGTSNFNISADEAAGTFGNIQAFASLNLACIASNNTSATLSSSTNWLTTGPLCHSFAIELIAAPCTNIGNITLS